MTDASAQQQWTEYRSAGTGYRIEMPGTPKVSTRELQHKIGPLKLTEAELELGDEYFSVSYLDMPSERITNSNANSILDGARDGAISGMAINGNKATLRSERRLIMSGYPARHLVADVPGLKLVSVMRIVLVGNRQITASFVGFSGSEMRPEVARFIDSFVILNARTGDTGLIGNMRNSFVGGAIQTCLKKQNSSPENAGMSADTITQYCVCYANGLADVVTDEDLRKSPPDGTISSTMQSKIDLAASPCIKAAAHARP